MRMLGIFMQRVETVDVGGSSNMVGPTPDALSPEVAGMLGLLVVGVGIALLISYVVSAVLLMMLFKNTDNARPWTAWVPLLNTVELLRTAGIARAWVWVLLITVGSVVVSWVPLLGWVLSLGLLAVSILVSVWMAQGIQRGLGLDSVGGVVLAILLPLPWLIWMVIRSSKQTWNEIAAQEYGQTFVLNRFLDRKNVI